jgi:hypothetical protein
MSSHNVNQLLVDPYDTKGTARVLPNIVHMYDKTQAEWTTGAPIF